VWEAELEGRLLHFFLSGINNQNFIMQDRETGSWWQQISGEAIQGPLKGRRLKLVDHDELTFVTWRSEAHNGRVLRPDAKIKSADKYATADWESRIRKLPVVIDPAGPSGFKARTLIIGITVGDVAKAYPFDILKRQNPIIDSINNEPIILILHSDGKSVRAFGRKLGSDNYDFYRAVDSSEFELIDSQTGSRWNFSGVAVSGPLAGRKLQQIYCLKDYWFDWKNYHPQTSIYNLH
jgi:Protein of unknown function (DUF3179)